MDDFEFAQDSGGVVCEGHFLQMVDHEFVAPIRTERRLHCAGDSSACVDITEDGAIFSVITAFEVR